MAKKEKTQKLTEKESVIMRLLWEHGAMSVAQMLEHYSEPRPHFNTVSTTVRILEDKGFVGHKAEGNRFFYHAIARQDDFRERTLANLIKDYFGNSYKRAVSALVEEKKISVDDLREIIGMIEGKEVPDKGTDNQDKGTDN
ncbi:MAG: BlaI/MecI/CopY family transcriptional regulator [Bacteroides sp.]|nr:BlaI/MecI/CopY family transcriptional regulator [Bacteroides sp.]